MSKKKVAIIGAGISGLAAGFFIQDRLGDNYDFTIYEKDNRTGGTIGTTRENGFIVDWGSNGFLDREPLTIDFINRIGLTNKLYKSNDKSNKRFIYRDNKLHEISPHPAKFLSSSLLSLRGRLRVAGELFVPAKKDETEETIFEFASRRIGKEAADILIDPMVSGIYGGDAKALSLPACFPVMEKMEKEYGGLIKALIKKKRKIKTGDKKGSPAGPSGHLTSFHNGLYTLIEHLESLLKDRIKKEAVLQEIRITDNRKLHLEFNGFSESCDIVILATPAYASAHTLQKTDPKTSDLLNQIPYGRLAVACKGYPISSVGRPLDGFGFLVPHNQNMNILGSIWTSIIYPEQAPEGYALFRTMLGGALNNEIIKESDQNISDLCHNDLSAVMSLTQKPEYERIFKWDRAIPQYTLGHPGRLKQIEDRLRDLGNIYLTGNAYSGIGLNDCIKRSHYIVESIRNSK